MIRAAFFTPTLLLGGAERWLVSLARSCRERVEWTGTALTERAPANAGLLREMAAFMPVYGGPWAGPAEGGETITRCRNGREALEAAVCRADVLIVWGMGNLARFVKDLSIPIVFVAHGGSSKVIRSSEPGATHLVAVSEAARMCFSPALRRNVTIIHNGIDVERCTPTLSREQIRASWGVGERHRLIGYVGRYSPEKNPAAAAWAAKFLGGNHYAVYMGEGRMAAELGRIADPRVRFVPVDRRVGNVLAGLDVFVLASPAEGFSLSMTEAWYCGVPVVATRVGAVPELERRYGPLVSPVPIDPTPGQLGRAVERALSAAFRREVVPRAHEAVCRHYTAGSMAERWADYLHSILSEGIPSNGRGHNSREFLTR